MRIKQGMFWKSIWLLLDLQRRLTVRTFARSSAALGGVLLFSLVFGPAAFAAGTACQARLSSLPATRQEEFLFPVLLVLQIIWLLSLFAGGVAGIGARLAPEVLSSYPIPRGAFVFASSIGALFDLPTAFAMPVFLGVSQGIGPPGTMNLAALPACSLLAMQVAATGEMVRHGKNAFRTQPRALLPLLLAVTGILLTAWSASSAMRMPGYAAIPGYLLLCAEIGVTLYLADRWCQGVVDLSPKTRPSERKARTIAREYERQWLSSLPVLMAVEGRNLIRDLATHLPLRLPAQLCLGIFFGWIAPNIGGDALLNARDLPGMGALLYFVLWQVQFVTNRFGSEAGTAALLFGFPMPRWQLLVARNLTMLALLLPLNGLLVSVVCVLLHAPGAIPAALGITLLVMLLLTAFGNIISALYPYPIARRTEGFFVEPDRSLVFLYVLLGIAIGGLFWAVSLLPPMFFVPSLVTATAGIYLSSVWIGSKILLAREIDVIARLDGE